MRRARGPVTLETTQLPERADHPPVIGFSGSPTQ
jgi:hypothetical protein